jgi:BirA family transcriptional regulator, biotin operon repressor / biotin---[acetyl-CoA-carboxylase] ligase
MLILIYYTKLQIVLIKKYNTILIGKVLQHLNECDSTNDFFKSRKRSSCFPEGMVVYSTNQKKGRGQFGNNWFDDPGKNLALSFIVYPKFLTIPDQYLLNMAISIALTEIIHHLTKEKVTIKWPNDIYVKNKKVVGILIENTLNQQNIQSSIIGLGINVNNPSFPAGLPNPVSLFQLTGQIFIMDELVVLICEIMDKWYLKLKSNLSKEILNTYNKQLHGKGMVQLFNQNGEAFAGIISGVNHQGQIIINCNDRNIACNHKSVEIIN